MQPTRCALTSPQNHPKHANHNPQVDLCLVPEVPIVTHGEKVRAPLGRARARSGQAHTRAALSPLAALFSLALTPRTKPRN